MPACMYKSKPIAFQFLHNEAFTAEQTGTEFFLKLYTNSNSFCSAEKSIFLTDHFSAKLLKIHRNNFSGVWRSEQYFFLPLSHIGKCSHKKAFTCKNSFTCTHKFAQKSFFLSSPITKNRFHLYAFVHHHKGASFGNCCFVRIEFYFHALH